MSTMISTFNLAKTTSTFGLIDQLRAAAVSQIEREALGLLHQYEEYKGTPIGLFIRLALKWHAGPEKQVLWDLFHEVIDFDYFLQSFSAFVAQALVDDGGYRVEWRVTPSALSGLGRQPQVRLSTKDDPHAAPVVVWDAMGIQSATSLIDLMYHWSEVNRVREQKFEELRQAAQARRAAKEKA